MKVTNDTAVVMTVGDLKELVELNRQQAQEELYNRIKGYLSNPKQVKAFIIKSKTKKRQPKEIVVGDNLGSMIGSEIKAQIVPGEVVKQYLVRKG